MYVSRLNVKVIKAAEASQHLLSLPGEHGVVPEGQENAGETYYLKGKAFYRIIDGFIDQAGANTDSVYGGQFRDDAGGLKLKHDRKVRYHQCVLC